MVCREVLKWSLECLDNLTNQIATSNCKEAINNYICNLGKKIVQNEPKTKKGEIPKNHKNIIEKETKLEPKEVTYFVSEVETRFIEVAQREGVDVPHQLEGDYSYYFITSKCCLVLVSFSILCFCWEFSLGSGSINDFLAQITNELFIASLQLEVAI